MDFKLVSKNNMGCAATLLLLVLLSQSRFLNFLIDTALGRSVLILFILFISYTNKILGIVSVLFVIILFNNTIDSTGFIEGLTTDASNNLSSVSSSNPISNPISNPVTLDNSNDKNTIQTDNTNDNIATTTSSVSATTATEGFDIVSKERYLQRGNQSNQIAVNDFVRDSDNIAPYEGSLQSALFSSY